MTTKKPAKSERVAALASSGIDSLALLGHLSGQFERVTPLYVQCGFRWEDGELFWLKKFLRAGKLKNVEPLEILSLPQREVYGAHWSVTGVKAPDVTAKPADLALPGRTLLFLTKAAVFCALRRIDSLAIGVLRSSPFPDANPAFFKRLEGILAEALEFHVRILAPFSDRQKEDVMQEAKPLGFEYSFSCINPKGYQHCGECYKCNERKKSFARTGIADRTLYYKRMAEATRAFS
jgi:7-cyano-7-deazaguanine synthase